MKQLLTQEERFIQMTETPIPRLISTLAVPTVINMLITSIYSMADTFFVSQISTRQCILRNVWSSLRIYCYLNSLGFWGFNYVFQSQMQLAFSFRW